MSTNTSEGGELFSLDRALFEADHLAIPSGLQGRRFAPVDWSPDGRRILGSLSKPGAKDRVTAIYDLDSEAYEPGPSSPAVNVSFFGDGQRIVWGDGDKLMLHDLRTGETRELLSTAPDGARAPILSPDGKTLYFLQHSAASDIHLLVAEDPR